ncbi:MAG: alpha-L-rhamnosidase N-terminal domain-containing protein, partial [Clostridia bacterium]|nr:alpha-L-rhamnosidase N-terminal domain-containing protein [Clostridia bacterium]
MLFLYRDSVVYDCRRRSRYSPHNDNFATNILHRGQSNVNALYIVFNNIIYLKYSYNGAKIFIIVLFMRKNKQAEADMSDLLNDLFSKKQGGLFEKAKFITTEYDSYFKPNSHVWVSRLMRNQKNDLEECDGLPVFIRDFEVGETSKATLYFTALGCADVYINGKRIGNDEFKPGWTDYNKRTLYCTYDVTENVVKGKNRILAVVS